MCILKKNTKLICTLKRCILTQTVILDAINHDYHLTDLAKRKMFLFSEWFWVIKDVKQYTFNNSLAPKTRDINQMLNNNNNC